MPVHVDLSKLSDFVKNDVVKKTEYKKLVSKIDNIDTTNLLKKSKYEKDGQILKIKSINKVNKKYLMLAVWLKKNRFQC